LIFFERCLVRTQSQQGQVKEQLARQGQRQPWAGTDAHGYGRRFIVRADEKLTASVELEAAIYRVIAYIKIRRRLTRISPPVLIV
jgi:hypothetical protein